MIRKLHSNDTIKTITLMNEYIEANKDSPSISMLDRKESVWVSYLVNAIHEQLSNNPHYIVVGDFDNNNNLNGFILAASFQSYYNNSTIMDIKDCVVKPGDKNGAYIVVRLFNEVMNHIKQYGGKHWRADSIRVNEDSLKYGKFLQKKYGGVIHFSINGIIKET